MIKTNSSYYNEMIGTVTATGSYGGEQVIFVNDQMCYMTQIIAVGRLPATESANGAEGNNNSGADSGSSDSTEGSDAAQGSGSEN